MTWTKEKHRAFMRIYMKTYWKNNPEQYEKFLIYKRKWDRDPKNKQKRKKYESNPEVRKRMRKYNNDYYYRNRKKIIEQHIESRQRLKLMEKKQ